MTTGDMIALGVSYVYASGLIGLGELLGRWQQFPQNITRKVIHIGAGMWVFGTLALFDTWYMGVVLFGTFVVLNYLFFRHRLFRAMDSEESTPGTVYFALSVALLFLMFWRTDTPQDYSYVAVAGVMAMTWGDALAAVIGKQWGRHRYTVSGTTRSFEGSLVMFIVSSLAIFLTLSLLPTSALSPLSISPTLTERGLSTLSGALVATLAEAVSPSGTDNLSVPLLSGVVIFAVLWLVP